MTGDAIDVARLVELCGPYLTDQDDIPAAVMQANADANEASDWLPYYKLALGLLAQATGLLCGAVDSVLSDQRLTPARLARLAAIAADAERLYRAHLIPCGVGPDRDPERLAEVRRLVAGCVLRGPAADPLPPEQPREANFNGDGS